MNGDNTNIKTELWRERISSFLESGLSRKEWCQQNQIPLSTFGYWNRKLEQASSVETQTAEMVFARLPSEIEVSPMPADDSSPVLIFMGSIRIQVSSGCPASLLSALLGALKSYA